MAVDLVAVVMAVVAKGQFAVEGTVLQAGWGSGGWPQPVAELGQAQGVGGCWVVGKAWSLVAERVLWQLAVSWWPVQAGSAVVQKLAGCWRPCWAQLPPGTGLQGRLLAEVPARRGPMLAACWGPCWADLLPGPGLQVRTQAAVLLAPDWADQMHPAAVWV